MLFRSLGKVYIRFQNTGQSNPDLNVDQLFISYSVVRRSVGYANGSIWVNTLTGIAGTENYVNGTADNPVLTWADALTLSTQLKIKKFNISNGSTITPAAGVTHSSLIGHDWTLVLNNQDYSDTHIEDADVSGIATVTDTGRIHFVGCKFGDCTLSRTTARSCGMTGTVKLGDAATHIYDSCFADDTGGAAPPEIDFNDEAATVGFRDYNGGIKIKTMASTSKFTFQGTGHVTIDATCDDGGAIGVNGCVILTDNVSGGFGGTLTDTARFEHNDEINDILADVTGINGNVMRGTDGVSLVIPDATGTAAGLHGTTNGKVDNVKSVVDNVKAETDKLDNMITEDVAGNEFTIEALVNAPTAEMDETELHAVLDTYSNKDDWKNSLTATQVVTALMADTGITEGGTMTFEKLMKILAAWIAGNWRSKSGSTTVKELLDADDGATVILEMTPKVTTPYRTITVKI